MKPAHIKIFSIVSILAFAFTFPGGATVALASPGCDPAYVSIAGNEITVSPTGVNDTANLQCAFDTAVAAGPGRHIQLVAGTYHTAQIIVYGFEGQFTGAGVEATEVVNLPNLPIGAGEFYLNPPSAENPYPILFHFVGGDFSVSNLAIRIQGHQPAQAWLLYGMGPFYELACAVAIVGTQAHAEFDYVMVNGQVDEAALFGYNLLNGIYYEGWMDWMGQPSPPISGSFSVSRSQFREAVWGTPIFNLSDAAVVISHNDYQDMLIGMDGGDLVNSSIEFSHNRVEVGLLGLDFYDSNLPEHVGSTYLIMNNLFRTGFIGVGFEQTFGLGNTCLLQGNNVGEVAEIGIYLGPGTRGCTVLGGSTKTNVLDLGTGNTLVGVNNMGEGVGPVVSSFLRGR